MHCFQLLIPLLNSLHRNLDFHVLHCQMFGVYVLSFFATEFILNWNWKTFVYLCGDYSQVLMSIMLSMFLGWCNFIFQVLLRFSAFFVFYKKYAGCCVHVIPTCFCNSTSGRSVTIFSPNTHGGQSDI
jgi:hypothetical protein